MRIHCFTFSHHIPTFEFFLLGPRSLDFSNVALCGFIVLLFHIDIPTFEFFLLGPPLTRFFKCRLVRIHCSPFLQHFPHSNLFLFPANFSNEIHCSPFFNSTCGNCFTFSQDPTFEFFLLGPPLIRFFQCRGSLCGFIVLLFHIVFPHSNSFS